MRRNDDCDRRVSKNFELGCCGLCLLNTGIVRRGQWNLYQILSARKGVTFILRQKNQYFGHITCKYGSQVSQRIFPCEDNNIFFFLVRNLDNAMNQLSFRLNLKCVIRYQLLLHRVFLRILLGAIILVAGIFTWQHDIEAGFTLYYANCLSFYFIVFWRWKLFCYNGKTNQSSILLILKVFVTTFKFIRQLC